MPMRETFSLDWDDPDEVELIKKFLKFHAKRLGCNEYEVLVKMAKELDKGVIDLAHLPKKLERKKKATTLGGAGQ
jgi:hypothetical protein